MSTDRLPVRYERDGFVARIGLHRPQRHNALNPQAMRLLRDAWRDYAVDRDARVAVLWGEGATFCSGMDIGQTHPGFGYRDGVEVDEAERAEGRRFEALPGEKRRLQYVPPHDLGKPVIAALHGRVSGGGLELALACDLRVAAEGTLIALPEVTRGIVPASGAMVWLPRIVGLGRALEMLLTGDPVTAEAALRFGLVNRVVPMAQLQASALQLAERIAANAPLAVQATRDATLRALGCGVAEGMEISENLSRVLKASADYEEGFRAFAEKRAPRFMGR
ncbi:MAG TPA: enoyl-CoA hydratase-related protein [Rubrivivax sp.]|nr:enoyl-CoA hydratase-related protein [Rubrivivax sp.]